MVTTIFFDNYFPPTIIEVKKYNDETYLNITTDLTPNDGVYENNVIGIWRVKYKKIDPLYYCDGQRNICG